MSGSVLYKFKSSTTQHTVHFDGPHIPLAELRAAIVRDNHIVKGRDFFDLELSNAQTGEVYAEDALIGRNTAVLVRRVPQYQVESIQVGTRPLPPLPRCAGGARAHAPTHQAPSHTRTPRAGRVARQRRRVHRPPGPHRR